MPVRSDVEKSLDELLVSVRSAESELTKGLRDIVRELINTRMTRQDASIGGYLFGSVLDLAATAVFRGQGRGLMHSKNKEWQERIEEVRPVIERVETEDLLRAIELLGSDADLDEVLMFLSKAGNNQYV